MADEKDKEKYEPSMEEILASIRRIISEEDEPASDSPAAPGAGAPPPQPKAQGPAAPPSAAPSPTASPKDDEDVLVLTEEVASAEEGAAAAPAPIEEPPLDLSDWPAEPPAPNAPPAMTPEPLSASSPEDRRLISEAAAKASLAALSELVARNQTEPEIESIPMGQSDRTLEDITRELLRPLLKNWLDANLPQIVERIVREEIGRLALDAQRR